MIPVPMNPSLGDAVEIIPDKLYLAPVRSEKHVQQMMSGGKTLCFSIDNDLLYEPFFADFGPLNLGLAYRYCTQLRQLLEAQAKQPEDKRQKVVHCTADDPFRKANSAALMGIYCVLFLDMPADEAYRPLTTLKPFAPFRDASCGASTFHLTVLDCLRGMERAKAVGFVDISQRQWRFNLQEYEYYEQVENGDLNWIVPGKFIAFSGPSAKRTEYYGYRTLVPEDYWDFFRKSGVSAVVRLNKKMYDRRRFQEGGFRHHELYFPDGSCPSEAILMRFLELAEAEPGVVCIHCKAGLGRTGVLICCYIMKHYRFTANEAIGYIRICRPGSVIGPQQHYLREMEAKCHRMGDRMRAAQAQAQYITSSVSPSPPGSLNSSVESYSDFSPDHRNTSPMKPLRTGTRPTVTAVTARLSGAMHVSMPPSPPSGGRYTSSSLMAGGKSLVASMRSSLPVTSTRSASSLPTMASGSGGSRESTVPAIMQTHPPIAQRHVAMSLLRRSADARGLLGSGQGARRHTPPHDSNGGPSGSSTAEVLSRLSRRQGGAGVSASADPVAPAPLNRAYYQGAEETMRRSSAAQYNVMSATQPHAATARRPASSTTSPLLQSQPPAFTGRIVTASGQPRKGAAAAAASIQASRYPNAGSVYSPPGVHHQPRTSLTPNPLRSRVGGVVDF